MMTMQRHPQRRRRTKNKRTSEDGYKEPAAPELVWQVFCVLIVKKSTNL